MIVVLIFFANCSSKIKAKPSQDSLTATEALRVIEEVRYAYENKKEKILKEHMTIILSSRVLQELNFDKAILNYSIQLVTLKNKKVYVKCNWESDVTIGSSQYSDEGSAVFVLKGMPLKIIDIEGTNPLRIPQI